MKRSLLFTGLILLCLFLCLSPSQVLAIQDTTPPSLTAFNFSPTAIDTGSGAATVTVNFTAADNQSGVKTFIVSFVSPSGHQYASQRMDLPLPQATWTGAASVSFRQFGEVGRWEINYVQVDDAAGNIWEKDSTQLNQLGFPVFVDVTGIPDTTPPVLTALSFSPAAINTGAGPATVTVNFSATDDISGTISFSAAFISPSGQQMVQNYIEGIPRLAWTSSITLTFPQYSENGTWTMYQIGLDDNVGNLTLLRAPQLTGLPNQITVTGQQDLAAPTLTALTLTPTTINTALAPATVDANISVSDNQSGISIIWLNFRNPSDTGGFSIPKQINPPQTSWSEVIHVTFPQFSPTGTWTLSVDLNDAAGNWQYITKDQLAASGFPTQLIVQGTVNSATALNSSTESSVYGQAVTLTATVSSSVSGAPVPTGTVTFMDGASSLGTASLIGGVARHTTSSLAAGSHGITGTYNGDSNFNPATSVGVTQTVQKAALIVTADNKSMPPGGPLPTLTATLSGFANGESSSVVSGSASLSTTATTSSPFGTYPITVSAGTLSAANYTFTFVNGVLTVMEEADLGVTMQGPSKPVLVDTTAAFTITLTNTGKNSATGVVITVVLPSSLTYASAGGSPVWTCNATPTGTVNCLKGVPIAVNETASLTLLVTAKCGTADGTQISNEVSVSFPGIDPTMENNTSSALMVVSNPTANITPGSAAFRSRGGAGTVTVASSTTCPWTAVSNSDFLTITASREGQAGGTVDYQIAPNAGTTSRTGTLSIAGRTFSVTQAAATPDNSQAAASLSAGGSSGFSTPGTSNTVEAGAADVTLGAGKSSAEGAAQLNQVWGTAVFSLKQNNTVVSEAGVPASPPTTAARIFIDYRSGIVAKSGVVEAGTISINTGMGIVNKGSNTAQLTFTLWDESGTVVAVGHGTLPVGNHRAVFIDQLSQLAPDFTMPAGFASTTGAGTLQIESDQPVSVVALRLTTNQRGETLMTSVPVADETRTLPGTTVYFPQVADGGGYQTEMVLMNPTSSSQTGQIRFYSDDGGPLTLHLAGDAGVGSSIYNYSIRSGGCYLFRTDGAPTVVHAGSAQVIPDTGTSAPVGVGVFSYSPTGTLFGSGILVTESGIPSAQPTTHALVFVDQTMDHLTGLALAAADGGAVHVTLKVLQGDGTQVVGTGTVDLSGNGHTARFVNELIAGLPEDFVGVLELTAPSPFVALTLRGLSNSRGEFLLTTFPVADFNQLSPTPIVFPQIADGGGYLTEIILLNTSGLPVNLKISFFGEDGLPLDVAK